MTGPVLISEKQADFQDTERSTAQTVAAMGSHVQGAGYDQVIKDLARTLAPDRFTRRDAAGAVWDWVKRNIRFESDESQLARMLGRHDELELLISPSVLLRARDKAGDCDDFTMLCCAMLAALGVTPLIKTYKCDRQDPARWSHVCAAAVLEDGTVFPVDASHGEYPGWEVPARDVYESQLWDMNGNKTGGPMRQRGLSGYVRESGWTGSEMTSTGRVAGPYPSLDVMTAYRRRGLNAIAAGKYGMGDAPDYQNAAGDWVNGATGRVYGSNFDGSPLNPGESVDPITGNVVWINPAGSSASLPNTGGGSSVWANLFGQLLNSGTRLASQEIGSGAQVLPNGNVLLPSGQVVSSSPSSSLGISSNALLLGGLVLGGILLISVIKK